MVGPGIVVCLDELLCRSRYKVQEVAQYLGREPSTSSSILSRCEKRMQIEAVIGRDIEKLDRIV